MIEESHRPVLALRRRPAPDHAAPRFDWAPEDEFEWGPEPRTLPAVEPATGPQLAAGVAAAGVLGVAAGDGFVAVAALLVASGGLAGATSALAMVATVARWGSADLGALAGGQAVLGAAVASGAIVLRVSSGLAAASLVLAARRRHGGLAGWIPPVALGLGASLVAAGPSLVGMPELAARLVGWVAAVPVAAAVAWLTSARPSVDRPLGAAAIALAGSAAVLAVVG